MTSVMFKNYFPNYDYQKDPLEDHGLDKESVNKAYQKIISGLSKMGVNNVDIDNISEDFKFFIETTEYVDYKTFVGTFQEQMGFFLDDLKDRSYAIIQTETNVSKSNIWMINLFLRLLGNRPPPTYIIPIMNTDIKEKDLPNVDILLFIDDVIYTGEQMSTYIGNLYAFGPEFLKEKDKSVVVGYSTETAAERLRKMGAVVYGKLLLTLKDKMDRVEKESFSLCDSGFLTRDLFLKKSNTIFQHKLADLISSFPGIYSGNFCASTPRRTYRFELDQPLIKNCDRNKDQCFDPFYKDERWQKYYTDTQKRYITRK